MTKLIAIDNGKCVCVWVVEGEMPIELKTVGGYSDTFIMDSMDEVRALIGKPETRIEKQVSTGYAGGLYMVYVDGKVLTPNGLAESTYNALCKIAGRELAWKGGEWELDEIRDA